MPKDKAFRTHNTYYVRISKGCVIQMVLYLDPRHVGWMTNSILKSVMEALRSRIRDKLLQESDVKNTQIDVYRGRDWQMAYFLRKAPHRHAVLIKNRNWEFPQQGNTVQQSSNIGTSDHAVRIKREDEEDIESTQTQTESQNSDDENDNENDNDNDNDNDTDNENEQQDLKPKLHVTYNGFSIFGKLLVVIVEPWPPFSDEETVQEPEYRQLSLDPYSGARQSSSVTPAPTRRSMSTRNITPDPRSRPQVPLFRDETPSEFND